MWVCLSELLPENTTTQIKGLADSPFIVFGHVVFKVNPMNIQSIFQSKLAKVKADRDAAKAKAEQAKADAAFLSDATEVGLDWEAKLSQKRVERMTEKEAFLRKKGEVLKTISDGESKILSIVEGLEAAGCLPQQLESLEKGILDTQDATNELLKDLNLL